MNQVARVGALALVGFSVVGCVVPAARYEEARSAIRVEQEAHRRTQERLTEVSRDMERLHASLSLRERKLEQLETELAEQRLSADVAGTERKFATEMVEQLRGELGRTGEHLREFAGERAKLSLALDAAEARARRLSACEASQADNAAIVRDLAVALHEPIAQGEVEVSVLEGRPVVRINSSELVGETAGEIGQKVITAIAAITARHAESRVAIRETGNVPAAEAAKRLRSVSDALTKSGLGAARLELSPAATPTAATPALELSVFAADDVAPEVEK